MTDILLKPEDTGEIPRTDPGQKTMNLAPYAAGLPPAMRRPDATGEIPLVDFQGPQPRPRPIPRPPKVDDRPLSAGEEVVWDAARIPTLSEVLAERQWQPKARTPGYRPRHRAKGRWYGPLVDGIAIGWDVCRRSM